MPRAVQHRPVILGHDQDVERFADPAGENGAEKRAEWDGEARLRRWLGWGRADFVLLASLQRHAPSLGRLPKGAPWLARTDLGLAIRLGHPLGRGNVGLGSILKEALVHPDASFYLRR